MHTNKLLFFSLLLAVCLTQFAADIYAPSLPAVAIALNSNIHLAQWSMAIYMFGVAVSQLIYGPLSEGIGRKIPLLLGLTIMFLGSLICVFAANINTLIIGRLVQGLGAGACAALWRSTFRDIFTGDDLAKYGSYLTVFIMFIVPVAPALGGYLQHYFGWRANFIFMATYALIALAVLQYGFQETNQHHHRDKLAWKFICTTFKTLLSSRIFMLMTICTFLTYGAFFAWFTTGSVLLIHLAGLSPVEFGWFSLFGGGAAYAAAGILNGKFVKKFGAKKMLRFGWLTMILSGILLLLGYFLFKVNAWAIMVPIILFYFGSTFIWPNAFAIAFTPFGKIAGYAGALYGFMQISGAAVLGGLSAYLPHNNQIPLALVIIISSLLAWRIYEIFISE